MHVLQSEMAFTSKRKRWNLTVFALISKHTTSRNVAYGHAIAVELPEPEKNFEKSEAPLCFP